MSDPIFTSEIEGESLVLSGSFNPAIFHPAWFSQNELMTSQEREAAKIEILSPEMTVLAWGGMSLQVELDRFQLASTQVADTLHLRDFAARVFRLLSHTPVSATGMNRHMHYKMKSVDDWHRVGHALAPKEVWHGLLLEPGTQSLTIKGKYPESKSQYALVKVEPSQRVTNGVYVGTNEHFSAEGALQAAELIELHWQEAQQRARNTTVEALKRCLQK